MAISVKITTTKFFVPSDPVLPPPHTHDHVGCPFFLRLKQEFRITLKKKQNKTKSVCVFCGDDAMPTIHKKLLNLVSLKFMNELARQVYTQHNLKTHFFFFFFREKKKQKQQEAKD